MRLLQRPVTISSSSRRSVLEALELPFFVQVLRSDFQQNRGGFTPDAKLRVACFHNTKNGSHHYFEKEIPMTFGAYINGWVEIPIIGPELRVIVWGDNIPKLEMTANCTIYLLK